MAASAYTDTVQKVYIAYYGRAADPVGLAYWSGEIDKAGGSLSAIMASFGASAEATTLYGSLTNTSKVNAIYQQSFGRDADFAGLMYYAGQLSAGTMTAASIAQNIFDGAAGDDATMLANKLVVAKAYTAAVDTAAEVVAYSGTTAADSARSLLSTVSATTVTAGFDVATSVAEIVSTAALVPTIAGKTFTLTNLTDTFTGGAGADVFTADNTATSSATSTADGLTGGLGTDVLNVFSDGTVDPVPQLTSVETVNLYDVDDIVFSLATATGVDTLNVIRGDGTQTVTVPSGTTVNFSTIDIADGAAITVAHAAATTSATIGLDGVAGNGNGTTTEDVIVTGAGLTSIVVNTSGTASDVENMTLAGIKTVTLNAGAKFTADNGGIATTSTVGVLNINGAGAVNLGTMDAGFVTVNASGNTGGVTLALNGDQTVYTGSAGNDVITASATNALATADKLAVTGGAGTDTLIVGDANDINTAADAARYSGFETVRLAATQNMTMFDGVENIEIAAATSASISNITATQASNTMVVSGAQTTALTLALATSSGTADAITLDLTSATATTNINVAGLAITGVETLTINSTTGVAASESDVAFASGGADKLTKIVVTGAAETEIALANVALAMTIDASAATAALTTSGALIAGSTIEGSTAADDITLSTNNGSTYNGNAGDDAFTGTVAQLVASGSGDTVINGGLGSDTLTVSTAVATLTDNHFTYVSGMEKMVTSTGSTSITTGGAWNSAFADGITITTGVIATTESWAYTGGLYDQDTTITTTSTTSTGAVTEDITIATGGGADSVTVTGDITWVGTTTSADGATISIDTAEGDDTISVTIGTLTVQSISQAITIDAGTGADSITKVGTNGTVVTTVADFVIADGDSLVASRDKITGYDSPVAATSLLGDMLDVAGGTVATAMTSTDSGTIKSHSITGGVVTFDDASAFATAVVISNGNLTDATTYLANNMTSGDSIIFTYDSTGNGTADATMLFDQGTLDTLVELVGVVGTSLTATAASTTGSAIIVG